MLQVRFSLILHPDTEDYDEARQEALDFIECSKDGWPGTIRLSSEIEVIEVDDD